MAVWYMWAVGTQAKHQKRFCAPGMEKEQPRARSDHDDGDLSYNLGGQVAPIPGDDGRQGPTESRICSEARRGACSEVQLQKIKEVRFLVHPRLWGMICICFRIYVSRPNGMIFF